MTTSRPGRSHRLTGRPRLASATSRLTAPGIGCRPIMVSPWVESGSVYNEEYRHTSLIATLRKTWGLGDAFTQRDASARTFDHVFSRDTPRDPDTWATVEALPVPAWTADPELIGKSLSGLGKTAGPALIGKAREMG